MDVDWNVVIWMLNSFDQRCWVYRRKPGQDKYTRLSLSYIKGEAWVVATTIAYSSSSVIFIMHAHTLAQDSSVSHFMNIHSTYQDNDVCHTNWIYTLTDIRTQFERAWDVLNGKYWNTDKYTKKTRQQASPVKT